MLVVAGVKTRPLLPATTFAVAAALEKAPPRPSQKAVTAAAGKFFFLYKIFTEIKMNQKEICSRKHFREQSAGD